MSLFFFVNISKSNSQKLGEVVQFIFKLIQNYRDIALMQSLIKIFGCGGIYNQSISGNVQDFIVTKFSDITDKIIPFF